MAAGDINLANVIYAGDTLDFTISVPDRPAPTWTLKYRLAPASGSVIDIAATASGTDHRVQVTATTTGAWAVGTYSWTAYVESGAGARYTLARGRLDIKPASASLAAGADTRTQAEVALDAIDAVLANRATADQKSYEIAGRSLERMEIDQLLQLRAYYAQKVAAARGITRQILVRM